MVDHTSEALVAEIQELHEILGEHHEAFTEVLGEIIEQAQEVYARDNIAKGLTEAATPAYYHLSTGVVTTAPDDGIIYFSTGGSGGAGGIYGPDYGSGRGGLGQNWTWNWELHH
jgi:hypothetical protein